MTSRFIMREQSANLKSISRMLMLFLVLAIGSNQIVFSQEFLDDKKIVVLFHSSDFSLFKQDFSAGLRNYIDNVQIDFPHTRITYELLGLNKLSSETRPNVLVDLLRDDQQADPASVVIAVLSPAAEFLLDHGDDIYADIPKIYALTSPPLAESLKAQDLQRTNIVPSSVLITARDTLTVIPKVLPMTQHIYVVSGADRVDLDFVATAREFSNDLLPTMDVNFLTGLPVHELNSTLSNLPENSAIFMLPYNADRNRVPLRTIDVLRSVLDSVNAPIFSSTSSLISEGIVGGSISDIEISGGLAAEAALAMLKGVEPETILPSAMVNYRFDQRQLQRWNIDEGLLPTGSLIENQELTFIESHPQELAILFAITGLLLFFVVFYRRQTNVLGAQKTLFESVINSIPDAILITDANAKILATNKGAEHVFALAPGELLGKDSRELIDFSVINDDKDETEDSSPGLAVEPKVLSFKKKSGEVFFGETIATQITSAEGEPLGRFALIRDVSKRLSLEEEQRQGQKMEALGNLVGGISHDFNNVLGVISGYAELSLTSDDVEFLQTNQSQILKAADRAKSLVAQIMTFSRDSNIVQKPIDLAALLDETMKLIKVSIPSSIDIVLKKAEGVRAVMGAAIQLQQIILNLTTNAYQAMKTSGGSITIALDRKQVGTEINLSHGVLGPGYYSVLSVCDTGPGMDPAVASRVFEPYFTTKSEGEGSGMGMAIVYNLAKAHGARVNLKTAVGEGTCITLYFKEATGVNVAQDTDNTIAVVRGEGGRILLVDDEEDLLDATEKLLSGIGYQPMAFNNPDEALEAFKRDPKEFDLLVSDQSMPKMTGIQLLREVRQLNPDFPAIICTGYSDVIDQQELGELTLDGILRKPYTLSEISAIIGLALSD